MQCPISVEGSECGADAETQNVWVSQLDERGSLHFNCAHGHRFHIGPHARWQMCRCQATEKSGENMDCLGGLDLEAEVLLATLAVHKGIQIIMPGANT